MKPAVANPKYSVACLRIVPRVGDPIRLTRHPRDLTMSNGEIYRAHAGYDVTAVTADTSMSPSVVDLTGIVGLLGIDAASLASGYLDGARAYLFLTTWLSPIEDEEPVVASTLGKIVFEDARYRVEEMALVDLMNQTVGDTYAPGCKKTFGGQEFGGCGVDLAPLTVTGTITSVTSAVEFRDDTRAEADDYFGIGTIRFTTGANAGLPAKEIQSYAADGTIVLFEPFYNAVEVGDEYEMVAGCRRSLAACKAHGNVTRFGGFPFVPSSSQYGQVGKK